VKNSETTMALSSQELRAAFVDFFKERGHKHLPSASLIPDAMSTTLFTIAGMEQFVPAFTGESPAPAPRAVTVQRCLRVAGAKSDIENVGRTGRHGTFLEMLGNFSFGDYYKREAILYAWAFLVGTLKLPENRLYVTVHVDDDESQVIWEREVGLPPSRITRFENDNFWTMGPTGPCGPSTEIFFDTGAEHATSPSDTGPNLGDRFVELWNVVFQQFNRTAHGVLHDLPVKGIDTGMGLERLLAVANGKASMYETDLFTDLVEAQPATGETSLTDGEQLVRKRIIADHARAVTFLVADGVYPSNTDRGYVLRFLTRRAIRNGRLLGYPPSFLTGLIPHVVTSLGSGYPELAASLDRIVAAVLTEEAAFTRTLERGSELLDEVIASARREQRPISGREVFTLHDTYGFPSELTREIAGESNVAIDMDGFEEAMEEQRERAREDARKKRAAVTVADVPAARTEFTGYDGLEAEGTVVSIVAGGRPVERIEAGAAAQIVLDKTSFYAERGGQIGDHGLITADGVRFAVHDAQYAGEAIAHAGTLESGAVAVGDRLRTAVDPHWRREIRRHHTSAHLLQRALRDVLGDEVTQAGSWVGVDRMRFDFRSPAGALSPEQRRAVVARVNEIIRDDHHLVTTVMTPAQAAASGAISMAGEKYGEAVRVVAAGPSLEFCGGTHAVSTGELGLFVLLSETSIGSGIRRIEASVSKAAEDYVLEQQSLVGALAETLSAKPADITERIERLQEELRELQRSVAQAKAREAAADADRFVSAAETLQGRPFVGAVVNDLDAEGLRSLSSAVRQKLGGGVVALAATQNGSVSLIVTAADDAVQGGVHAGNLVKLAAEHIGGKGGGQAAQAQGGGKNPAGAADAIGAIRRALGG
jgi:alanyl-tRNA synthetase